MAEVVERMTQLTDSKQTLNKRYLELTELRHVLRETAVFFEEAETKTEDIMGRTTNEDYQLLATNDHDLDHVERGGAERTTAGIGLALKILSYLGLLLVWFLALAWKSLNVFFGVFLEAIVT